MAVHFQGFHRFVSWWRDELTDVLQGTRTGTEDRTLIEIDGETARQVGGDRKGRGATSEKFADVLASVPRQSARDVVIRLPRQAFFIRDVQLPATARRDFSRLLSIDLERATPFKSADVYCGHSVLASSDPRRQMVRHSVIKRSVVAPYREAIEASGLRFAGATYASERDDAPIAFDSSTHGESGQRRSAAKTLLALVIALVASASFVSVYRQETALAQLVGQTSALKADARAVRERFAAATAADAEIADFNGLRAAYPSRAAIVEELTRVIPDSAHLTELKIKGTSVDFGGFADSASALLPLIEASSHFVDVQSLAPVTFDQQIGKERFSIRAQLEDVTLPTDDAAKVAPDAETVAHDVTDGEVQ